MNAMEPNTAPSIVDPIEITQLDRTRPLRALDRAHVAVLAGVLDSCPPIVVQVGTLRVVDGHMRVAAAELLGRATLPVRWVHGGEARLVELAATANSRHGLPLTAAERKDAARRLLDVAPGWSNRRVAKTCGISEASVRRLRCPPASPAHVDKRIGIDGKAYPTSTRAPQAARELLASVPRASDRAIARTTGVSPTTVGRLRRAGHPEPPHPHSRPHEPQRWPWARRWLQVARWLRGALGHARVRWDVQSRSHDPRKFRSRLGRHGVDVNGHLG